MSCSTHPEVQVKSRIKLVSAAMAAASLFAWTPAHAVDWQVNANVVSIQATFMPNLIVIAISGNAGTTPACATGQLLSYYPGGADAEARAQNAAAVFSMLISAKLSHSTVTFSGIDANCTVQFVTMI
jgi:hypothetical protein